MRRASRTLKNCLLPHPLPFGHRRRVAWAWGYAGQFALLVPELRLAVATAAISPKPEEVFGQTNAVMMLAARLVERARS